jgi:hypothetical protein
MSDTYVPLTKEAIAKLREVQRLILNEPELYDQTKFPSKKETWCGDGSLSGVGCYAPCCLAGWLAWVDSPNPEEYDQLVEREVFLDEVYIAKSLGVTITQGLLLFSQWPEDKYKAAWYNPGTKEAAAAGVARINEFIKSGGTV